MNKTEHIKKALLKALEKSLGVVTSACKNVGVGRTTYYDWYNNDPEFAKKVDELENVALDFAESQLHRQIAENNTSATIFYLKTDVNQLCIRTKDHYPQYFVQCFEAIPLYLNHYI